jgi:NAD(P)-dependent dehydrogenase (short-subunit alcohol dehydrogenase family)
MAEIPLMAGKSVLVTGGTGGIGMATAAALGARVGRTGRARRAATGNQRWMSLPPACPPGCEVGRPGGGHHRVWAC